MNTVSAVERTFRTLLPSPLSIALLLTLLTMLLAWLFTGAETTRGNRAIGIMSMWEQGLWSPPLLVFAMQMMLMLVLGHVLALSAPAAWVIGRATRYCDTSARAAVLVTLLTLMVSLFNWGLGLVFGAIFARKVGEHAAQRGQQFNYPLIGAAGYSGMMVWHGGISGSAPIKAAEQGHIVALLEPFLSGHDLGTLPDTVSLTETVFSPMNITATALVMLLLPLFMWLLALRNPGSDTALPDVVEVKRTGNEVIGLMGAERMDRSKLFPLLLGLGMLLWCARLVLEQPQGSGLSFINPNYINLLLLGLGLLAHRSIMDFLSALDSAIGGASGILIQFPLYFGIMGVMGGSGLARQLSDFFVGIADGTTFPLLTMLSAGIVNVFVPSGGGQWGIQGPILIKAALSLDVSIPKGIMSLAYGDQLTNMLQPFWALPLLGITGLKAREILPYTLLLMVPGAIIFGLVLLVY